ncbi:FAD dependent oxidoreductase [Thalassoporum mexicanum PCC 7367]|uniref:NAD(P)/FAD-dependent oxidoreductase n=1 Tax=Thalassoporum mexicanum TaxID=3457544 RepID=UPI00029FEFB5|nr:FAD-binding oxidoreductase [Pseudanabaena sp. PCC 7367]AFY69828.1 FAD dependent oxidoreductase [Pseudanabaena sp. PCC 7367]
MKTYDWIVIGAGITGAALAYELAKGGASVLAIDRSADFANATRFSYGGIFYWAGSTPLTQQLSHEGIEIQRNLSSELGFDTEFRNLPLLLTIAKDEDPDVMAAAYDNVELPPQRISVAEAQEIEPYLDPNNINGALLFQHAQVRAKSLATAYRSALQNLGGQILIAEVEQLLSDLVLSDLDQNKQDLQDREVNKRITSIATSQGNFQAENIVICAGGFSRELLRVSGLPTSFLYFTHAELIDVADARGVALRSLVMPSDMNRLQLEFAASTKEKDPQWDQPNLQLVPPMVDAGAVQFNDRSIRLGQLSRIQTTANAKVDAIASEAQIRHKVANVLPQLANLPGQWQHCLVAFSHDALPIVGKLPAYSNVHLFTSFTAPMVYVPTLAKRYAAFVLSGATSDDVIDQLSIDRFGYK